MRSWLALSPALAAATALALPSQLTFSASSAESTPLDLGTVLKDAWHGVQHSQPIGWAEQGVREFSHRVQESGISCTFLFRLPHSDAAASHLLSSRTRKVTDPPTCRRVDPACRLSRPLTPHEGAKGSLRLVVEILLRVPRHRRRRPPLLLVLRVEVKAPRTGSPRPLDQRRTGREYSSGSRAGLFSRVTDPHGVCRQCSSTTGLLFELGPCAVANDGLNTTYNPHSWTESANVIFLDSPVQVGCESHKMQTLLAISAALPYRILRLLRGRDSCD